MTSTIPPFEKENLTLIINAILCYCISFIIMVCFHEGAHWLCGIYFNDKPILHHNYVMGGGATVTLQQMAMIKLAGPFVSLILGFLAYLGFRIVKTNSNIKLGLIWFSFWGISNFLGYFATAFFIKNGDIAGAYRLLNTPIWLQSIITVISIFILLKFIYHLTPHFSFF